jgi:hypothetical protein
LDNLVAIYNGTTGNVHKHMASMHSSLHLAHKRQSLEPKQLISISTSAFASTNNIRAFIKSDNDVVNRKAPLSFAIDVDLNEVF